MSEVTSDNELESLDTPIGGNELVSSSSSHLRSNSKSVGDELFGDGVSCDLSDMERKREGSFDDDGPFLDDADDELLKELLGDDFGKSFETSPYNEMTETSLDLRTPLGPGSVLSETLKPDDSMFESAETSDPALSHGNEGPKRPCSGKAAVTSITLCQWIKNNMPQGLCSWNDLNNYIMTAIPIAIELARLLVEEDGANFEIVLKSSEISLQARGNDFTHVEVQRSTKTPAANRLTRLASLGAVLYELFTGLVLPSKSADLQPNAGMDEFDLGVNAILNMLRDEDHLSMLRDDDSQAKRKGVPSKSRGAIDQYHHEKVMSCLDDVGLPSSIRCIITNLLDCSQSDFRVDEAYSSFEDVVADLGLVRDNPECYLKSLGDKPKFSIPDKLYGRQETMDKIANLYACETCNCLVVNGRAGAGKSSLLSQVFNNIAQKDGCHLLQIEFEQGGVNPLAKIAFCINSLCESFLRDATSRAKSTVALELESALGDVGAYALALIIPSLSKILEKEAPCLTEQFIDKAATVRYSFCKLLEVMSPHIPPVIIVFDDLQFADDSSRSMVSSLLEDAAQSAFFVCCYRDDDLKSGDPFLLWLESIGSSMTQRIEIGNLTIGDVNNMVSQTLKAFPRITLPLSTQLHAKTRGNPLFLRQFIESIQHQGLISLRLNPPRWAWDIEKISNIELSESVVGLLVEEMRTLSPDLKNGLRVVSCLGLKVRKKTLDSILSDLGMSLANILGALVNKGYLVEVKNTEVRFSHGKVQQSAYETMKVAEQKKLHRKLGMILLDLVVHDETLLSVAASQINLGGINASLDRRKCLAIAALNRKAGKRAQDMASFDSALRFFQSGILWVPAGERWSTDYSISLALHTSAVETACLLNNLDVVKGLTVTVTANAMNDKDKTACLFCLMKCLGTNGKLIASRDVAFSILQQSGEALPREVGDPDLAMDIKTMVSTLHAYSDEVILAMKASHKAERDVLALDVYYFLCNIYTECSPKHVLDATLQMLRITLSNGLSAISPLAFATFAVSLVGLGENELACRVSRLAKRLLVRPECQRFTSSVLYTLGVCVDWVAEPIQSLAVSLLNGQRSGLQVGDMAHARHNYRNALFYEYFGGKQLSYCRDAFRETVEGCKKEKQVLWFAHAALVHRMCVALIEGVGFADSFPSWSDISSDLEENRDSSIVFQAHGYMRSFLFQLHDDVMEGEGLLSRIQTATDTPVLRPMFVLGVFYEGLLSFQLTGLRRDPIFSARGTKALEFVETFSKSNPFTFENKYLLLKASKLELSDLDQAWLAYQGAIKSASDHKLPHEEALASEMAGRCLFKGGVSNRSHGLYKHALSKYQSWGADAIVQRLEKEMQQKFGVLYSPLIEESLLAADIYSLGMDGIFDTRNETSNKRSQY